MRAKFVLLIVGLSIAATSMPSASAQTEQGSAETGQKVIKDPVEYNAYIAALNTPDPAGRAAKMDAFVTSYPHSVMLVGALEQAMAVYQQANDSAKVESTARRIIQVEPGHIRALAIVAALDRAKATTAGDRAALTEMCADSQAGVQKLPAWQAPEGMKFV